MNRHFESSRIPPRALEPVAARCPLVLTPRCGQLVGRVGTMKIALASGTLSYEFDLRLTEAPLRSRTTLTMRIATAALVQALWLAPLCISSPPEPLRTSEFDPTDNHRLTGSPDAPIAVAVETKPLAGGSQARQKPEPPGTMTATAEMLRVPQTWPAPGFHSEGLEAVFFEGPPWKGKPTRVFAWIGLPALKPEQKAPAIVLVHGGGGTAFDTWVRLWVSRGYAAIAMDTCGNVPRGSYAKWEHHGAGGPSGNDFSAANEPIADQWPFHAVADVILAHSLLRSRSGVDADRIGITGISWGGYLTCLVSGLDDRFKFAVPVYGCGFLGEGSVWKPEIARLGVRGEHWLTMWDPAHYLVKGTMPKLWVTGTNDFAYPLDSLQKSYRIACGSSTLCIRPRMPHGHGGAGENPEEIRAFADAIVHGGKPLTKVIRQEQDGDRIRVEILGEVAVHRAELVYTKEFGPWTDRRWDLAAGRVETGGRIVTAALPPGTTAYFVNVIDDRNLIVSTEHVSLELTRK
jgi:dienelactone hydrolase